MEVSKIIALAKTTKPGARRGSTILNPGTKKGDLGQGVALLHVPTWRVMRATSVFDETHEYRLKVVRVAEDTNLLLASEFMPPPTLEQARNLYESMREIATASNTEKASGKDPAD